MEAASILDFETLISDFQELWKRLIMYVSFIMTFVRFDFFCGQSRYVEGEIVVFGLVPIHQDPRKFSWPVKNERIVTSFTSRTHVTS